MHPCNRGETLTRSVQENAANRTAAIRTRAQRCERPELFIGLGACDNDGVCASSFPRKIFPSMPRSKTLRGKCPGATGYFAKALAVRTRPGVAFIIIPAFWCQ